ncbi:MAG: hypothetical protein A2W23_07020 [Planctomycetes bacterium RBG_16_43_13]|nr:MAG: hypothetical protein A2W23_07020 [Planctomycetes bacterium RBG_16_43_13]
MLERIKKLLGLKSVPEEVTPLYKGARNEKEALFLLREARRRDEGRRRRAIQDLELLDKIESQLINQGKKEGSENKKRIIAKKIKEVRWKAKDINHKIDNIYNKRIKVFNEHIQSLETLIDIEDVTLPDERAIENLAIKAKEKLDELDKVTELSDGISKATESTAIDDEEKEILAEFEEEADLEIAREELNTDAPIRKEEKAKEKKKKEPEQEIE